VALEATFQDLVAKLGALREAVTGLQITVIEDRPLDGGVLLVERLGNATDDLRGLVEEAFAAALEATQAVGNPLDSYRARNALANANRQFVCLEYKFLIEQLSADHLNELRKLGRNHGREWHGWTGSVIDALTQCRGPVRDVDDAFLSSWQDLSERLGSGGVSVQTTNIGAIAAPTRQRRKQPDAMDDAAMRQQAWK
jgi:hypothetical protein